MKLPEEPIFNYVIFVIATLVISFAVVSVKFLNIRNELEVLKSKYDNETSKVQNSRRLPNARMDR